MKQYRILVVDDSAFMRRAISMLLEKDPQISVAGIARNGEEAVEKVKLLKPDLVTMDVEMPKMNGLEALEEIMKTNPVPVVMLSSRTGEGAKETLEALELGAVDFFLKDYLIKNNEGNQNREFLMKLKGILNAKTSISNSHKVFQRESIRKKNKRKPELIFIGCSTGGPSALQKILPHFPKDFPIPIVVAQHMPPGFTHPLADRFDTLCQLKVREAASDLVVEPGTIYIAPSGYQTKFSKNSDDGVIFIVEKQENEKALYKPSVDVSLQSAAPIYKDRLLSVILTGMGVDGMLGCGVVKKHDGTVFVEAEESCIVYGMPKAVLDAGFADGQYEITKMFQEIISFI